MGVHAILAAAALLAGTFEESELSAWQHTFSTEGVTVVVVRTESPAEAWLTEQLADVVPVVAPFLDQVPGPWDRRPDVDLPSGGGR